MKKFIKYTVIFTIILVLLGFAFYTGIRYFMPELFEGVTLKFSENQLAKYAEEFNYCEKDSDCAWAQSTVCGCKEGGMMAPLNKNKISDLENIRKRSVRTVSPCRTVFTCDYYKDKHLRCLQQKCTPGLN
ncbi:hypothetical protein Dip510_000866 [Elusimicrobium posterum]|uniref:hypothetical protein n=1 Tax=Elusimicrobium posterum TaxID=3116653 RepID=UPI003C790976